MSIKRGSTKILNVKRGSTQIKKICRGSTVIWEYRVSETGKFYSAKWSGKSYGGMTYESGEISLSGSYKIEGFGIHHEVLREDINGKEEGRYVAKGWDGEKWVVLLDHVTNNQTEWNIDVFVSSQNPTVEVSKLKYEFYIVDTISRSYSGTMELWVSTLK